MPARENGLAGAARVGRVKEGEGGEGFLKRSAYVNYGA
jgi:hypothetical protein